MIYFKPTLILQALIVLLLTTISTEMVGHNTHFKNSTTSLFMCDRVADSLVLVDLYDSTDGANWTTTWDLSQPMDTWNGITLGDAGCVTQINLNYKNLNGTIPTSLGNLENLSYLDFSTNFLLTGSIPPELGQLVNLTGLNFRSCDLSGSIPKELGNLVNVTFVDFSSNDLSGCFPDELVSWCSAPYIQISGNPNLPSFNAFCEDGTGSCSPQPCRYRDSLSLLELYNTTNGANWTNTWGLSQSMDTWTGVTLVDGCVTHINLDNNNLVGTVPAELGNLLSLSYLSLTNNQLSGSIPEELSGAISLTTLRLQGNQLSGQIPASLATLNLSILNVANNFLSGCFPLEFDVFCNSITNFSNNSNLSGGGDFDAFCATTAGSCAETVCMVSNTNLDGPGSFLEAINCANNNPGPDTIIFNLDINTYGEGPYIFNSDDTPTLEDHYTFIDGTSQSNFELGDIVLQSFIQIFGNNCKLQGLHIKGGLSVNGYSGGFYQRANDVEIIGNVFSEGSTAIWSVGTRGLKVINNRIGTDATGTIAMPNTGGLYMNTCSDVIIENNVISNNTEDGIQIYSSSRATLRNNKIGTDITGTIPMGNGRRGVGLHAGAYGTFEEDNIIAYNGADGVWVNNFSHVRFINCSIHNNGGYGIYANDGGEIETYQTSIYCNTYLGIGLYDNSNSYHTNGIEQASPVIISADETGVSGTHPSNDSQIIDVYLETQTCTDCAIGRPQGQTFLGTTTATNGLWTLNAADFQIPITTGNVTAIATHENTSPNPDEDWFDYSSRFAECFPVTVNETCPMTQNIVPTVISGRVVKINWDVEPAAVRYRIRYRKTGNAWTELLTANTEPFRFINNLDFVTTYEVQVKTLCGTENAVWSSPVFFTTTDANCDFPTNTGVLNITPTSASPYWIPYPDDIKYKIKHKTATGGSWIETIINSTSYDITGLNSSTLYKYKLKTKCEGGWTNWSSSYTFITSSTFANREIQENNFSSSLKVYPNPVSEHLFVELNSEEIQAMFIRSIDGKTNRQIAITNSTMQINVADLTEGIYILQVVQKDGTLKNQKFIKSIH